MAVDTAQQTYSSGVETLTNETFTNLVKNGDTTEIAQNVTGTLSGGELSTIVDEGQYYVPVQDGTVSFFHYEQAGEGFYDAPTTSTTAIQKTVPAGPITEYNSNASNIQRGEITQVYNTSVTQDSKVNLSSTPKSGGFSQNAAYFLGEVNQAVAAASVGIMLGKTIDNLLYNANPDYWDSIGMSTLNPETWNSITHGDDSLNAALFNFIFGLDPDTGEGQAYLSAEAFTYLAMVLNEANWFASGNSQATYTSGNNLHYNYWPNPININPNCTNIIVQNLNASPNGGYYLSLSTGVYVICVSNGTASGASFAVSTSPFSYGSKWANNIATGSYKTPDTSVATQRTTRNGTPYYGVILNSSYGLPYNGAGNIIGNKPAADATDALRDIATMVLDGSIEQITPQEGVSNQEGATTPDTTGWDTLTDTLTSLQNQYPDLFGDAITYDQLQPDGTTKEVMYIPVGFPSTLPNTWTDVQPVTGTATQSNPKVDYNQLPTSETSPITNTLTQPKTTNPNPNDNVPQNPVDTGSGDSPEIVAPTGSASALWSVYHPTQAQINAFGAWLWGSPFSTDIMKLFQNPMEGVISLHKVFATPVDSGSSTIVVGTLDSGVGSATVTQQYVYVDCGSVSLVEDFANVFDYPPYTQVSIYLPFIGIVPLDVNDVMRSTINVTYGVDVFTGACLAIVKVTRDGHTAALYQYAGMCSVEYPLSNIQNSNLVGGLLTIAGGVASMMGSGGVSAPAVLTAVAGAASASKSSVGRSGGFSGNAGAMGAKKPYIIIQRPQTRVANSFPQLAGYPTNKSGKLNNFTGQVNVVHVHVEGIQATDTELTQIEALLKSGVLI